MDQFGKASVSTASSFSSQSFSLPSSINGKAVSQSMSKSFQTLSLRHSRPAMSKDLLDVETTCRLSMRFESRLKISENSTKTILRHANATKMTLNGERAPAPAAAQGGSATRRLVEKLQRKEREEMARIQKQLALQKARQAKVMIESSLPGQRRKHIEQLEQVVREKQERIKQAHLKKKQDERERLEQEQRLRKAQEEELRKARELEIARKAKEEAERKAKQEAEQKAREEAERIAKEAAAKAKAEAIEKQEEENKKKAEEEKKLVQPQDIQQEEDKVEDVPDISSSLLPQNMLASRNKPYLKPCAELSAQIQKNIAAWSAFEADMLKYKSSELKLDKPFYQVYEQGGQELVSSVGEAINRVANTIVRPDKNQAPERIDMELQIYTDKLITRLIALNTEFAHNPDVFKFAVYKLVTGFAQSKFVSQAKQKEPEKRQEGLVDFIVNIFDRLHFQLPQLYLKEMVLGFVAGRNQLFFPRNAQLSECGNSELKWIEQRGYRVSPASKKRESVTATIGRLTIHATIFFALHLSDAYLGRLFMMLSTLLCLQYTQNQAQVLLHLLEIGGNKLLEVYGKAFVDQLTICKTEFIGGFRAYMNDPNGMAKEPQNKPEYLEDGDTGIRETGLELDKLARLTDQLLQKASQLRP